MLFLKKNLKLKISGIVVFLCGIFHLYLSSSLQAENLPLWELGIGIGVFTMPDYNGSDHQQYYGFPIPYVVYRGELFKVDRENIRGLFFKSDHVELDVTINGKPPVNSNKKNTREGMPDIDPTLEFGIQGNVFLLKTERKKISFKFPLREVISIDGYEIAHRGFLFNPVINCDFNERILNQYWQLNMFCGPMFSTKTYHRYFYGVDTKYATPERPEYDASCGYSGTVLGISLSRRFERFWIGAFVRAQDLHSTCFRDSPLFKQKTAIMAGVGISWICTQSDNYVVTPY
ncbi:MAG: MipA/OmpV family protein [Desulfobacterales bacterium]|nr:MipA/OmpV family protein [Desulfobacterales bacterium]